MGCRGFHQKMDVVGPLELDVLSPWSVFDASAQVPCCRRIERIGPLIGEAGRSRSSSKSGSRRKTATQTVEPAISNYLSSGIRV
ncbi:hypothetical protein VNO78_08181 [Psophocarpus tetragonolobus]|uniref:Uncharacterized protein n=1 Tax=Psophocarpus tetragonolobus TaxID=3891 RepID=A0AAN9XT48_PSOTE